MCEEDAGYKEDLERNLSLVLVNLGNGIGVMQREGVILPWVALGKLEPFV